MKTNYPFTILLCLLMACAGCADTARKDREVTFTVSILPLKNIVGNITGDDFPIEVLVPPGASPETFEPTPPQLVAVNDSRLVFTTGLIDFERALTGKLEQQDGSERFVDLSKGIALIEGGGHTHSHANGSHTHHGAGVDPHIWSSPRNVKQMAATVMERIATLYPDSVRYNANYERFISRLDSLDGWIAQQIAACGTTSFIIYHPAMTYYARDYGLEQIAIEHEGKEPAVEKLQQLVNKAKASGIKTIFYQRQFSPATVQAIAAEIGAKAVEIDPLAEDIIENLDVITQKICADVPCGD